MTNQNPVEDMLNAIAKELGMPRDELGAVAGEQRTDAERSEISDAGIDLAYQAVNRMKLLADPGPGGDVSDGVRSVSDMFMGAVGVFASAIAEIDVYIQLGTGSAAILVDNTTGEKRNYKSASMEIFSEAYDHAAEKYATEMQAEMDAKEGGSSDA